MSDPDQEEMRRKRLARLSAMSGGGGGGPSPAPAPVVSPVVGEKTDKGRLFDGTGKGNKSCHMYI